MAEKIRGGGSVGGERSGFRVEELVERAAHWGTLCPIVLKGGAQSLHRESGFTPGILMSGV